MAGRQAASGPASSPEAGLKLLGEALALARSYSVAEAWEVRLRFVAGLMSAAATGIAEVRKPSAWRLFQPHCYPPPQYTCVFVFVVQNPPCSHKR